ncbi:MAG: metallophosphoesterase [Prevotella sp.]|nr:metallophosphoesterase [Prevotella sp.]
MKMFFIFFFIILIGGLTYVLWHIWCVLPFQRGVKLGIIILLSLCFLMMFLNFGIIDRLPLNLGSIVYNVGWSSLVVLLYLVMTFLVLDLGRLVRLVPKAWLHSNGITAAAILALMLGVFIYGNIHYNNKYRETLSFTTTKPLDSGKKIVMLSDLHLGYHNRRAELDRWIDLINAEKPDLVLIAGDIVDMSLRPLEEEQMAQSFHRLTAPVYACLGNHEYFSRSPGVQRFYEEAGIRLLRDTAVVAGDLCLIGRDDRTNRNRKPLADIMAQADTTRYTILIDHQPYHLEEAEQCGIDFQFSGHTHHGQVWPITWITESTYECAFGPWQRGNTRYYITSGLGIWGGKYRIGTRSEYVVCELAPSRSLPEGRGSQSENL